jgi:hypothetical protein
VAQHATRGGDENSLANEATAPLPGDACCVELAGGHEAERLSGQLGDGPVIGASHGGRSYGGGMTVDGVPGFAR